MRFTEHELSELWFPRQLANFSQTRSKNGQKTVKSPLPLYVQFFAYPPPAWKATDYHCFGAHARMINTVASTRDTNLFAQRLEPNSRHFRTGFSSMRPSQTQLSTALQTASMDGAGFSYSYPIHILNCQQLLSCTLILVRHHRILQMSRLSAEAF
jgi:hypothetical protein